MTDTRPISWVKAARKDFERFPEKVQIEGLTALTVAAEGSKTDNSKPLHGLGSGVFEIVLDDRAGTFRVAYAVQLGEDLWVVHAFQKKSKAGEEDAAAGNRSDPRASEAPEGDATMNDDLEVIRGKGNVFRDLGYAKADAEHLKAVLSAQIIKVLDARKMTVRKAEDVTGIAAADFSRIRKAKLDRFTIDRLMTILGRLDQDVKIEITVCPKDARASAAQR